MQVQRKQQSNQVYHQQQQQRHSHNVKEEVSQSAIHGQSDDMELQNVPRFNHETPLHGLVGKIEPQANSLFTSQISRGKQFGDFLAQIHTPSEQCRTTESSLHMLMQQDHLRQMCQLYYIQQVRQLQLLRNQNKINYV
jgi:hypothetical protein